MANSIFEFQLSYPGKTTLPLPTNSAGQVTILSAEVQDQRNVLVYVVTDSRQSYTDVVFYCAETGIDTLPDPDADHSWTRLNTCMLGDGSYVIHVFVQNGIQ